MGQNEVIMEILLYEEQKKTKNGREKHLKSRTQMRNWKNVRRMAKF